MTNYFINDILESTIANTPALDMTGDDTLMLAPGGELVATGDSSAALYIDSGATGNVAVIDGTLMASGNGIEDHSVYMGLTLNGTIAAENEGILVNTTGFAIIGIGTAGVVEGGNDGIVLEANNTTVSNNGNIDGLEVAIWNNGTGSTIVNNGTIAGLIAIQMVSGNLAVTNNGLISGEITSINESNFTFTNNGTLNGAVTLIANDLVDNAGTIRGNVAMGTGETLDNTGIIHGNISFVGGTNIFDTRHGEVTGTVTGGSGSDTFLAGSAPVTFIGGSGTEVLTGGAGDDTITAGSGKDTITGGKGDDFLTAGTGKDIFVYNGNFGNDTIADFNTRRDVIHFAANDFTSYSELQSHMAQAGTDVVITLDANNSIVLMHETLASFTSSDFTFG